MKDESFFTFWEKIKFIPSAMMEIWRNFFCGRRKDALLMFLFLVLVTSIYATVSGHQLDKEYGTGIFLTVSTIIISALAWFFALPAACYLIDLKHKEKSSKIIQRSKGKIVTIEQK